MNQPDDFAPPRAAGLVLTAAALGFVAVFSYLAARFSYPDVLARPPNEVLPALLAGGASLRAAWFFYAVLPLGIVVAALLVEARRLPKLTRVSGVLAGLAMSTGIIRWSTLQWWLANDWANATEPARRAIAARSELLNLVLGNIVGELFGEVLLATWLFGVGLSLRRRWLGKGVLLLAALLIAGSLRNVLTAAQPVTDLTNVLLPLVLVWLGLTWTLRGVALRGSRSATSTALVPVLIGLSAPPARADELPEREIMLHGFRSPSMGVELREGWLGFHLGAYPTIVDEAPDGAPRTTWFSKSGLTAYVFQFDAGSGRPSAPFISVGLLQGLGGSWDVSKGVRSGSAVSGEVGFRWAAWRGLDLRLGAALLVGFDGRVRFNPTPGLSWAIPF